jgi:hypothetical protein
LNLWLSALRNTTTIASVDAAPGLAELIPDALSLLSNNHDLLGTTINIIESYILLDAPGLTQVIPMLKFLHNTEECSQAYGIPLFEAITAALQSDGLTMNMKDLVVLLNFYVQLAPCTAWTSHMNSSGLFAWILDKVVENEVKKLIQ